MTYASWMPRYRVMTAEPGKLDLFVVTLIDGQRAAVQPVTEYDAAVAKARAFVGEHRRQVKVLPMTGVELRNLLGIKPASPTPIDAADRQQMIDLLKDIAREGEGPDARRDAFDLLTDMGAIQP